VIRKVEHHCKAKFVHGVGLLAGLLASGLAHAQMSKHPAQIEAEREIFARFKGATAVFKCDEGNGANFTLHVNVDKLAVKIIRGGDSVEYVNGKTTKGGLGATGGFGSVITMTDQVFLIAPTLQWRLNMRNGEMTLNSGQGGSINLTTGRFQALWNGDIRAVCKPS
jgi:hypothetical protein